MKSISQSFSAVVSHRSRVLGPARIRPTITLSYAFNILYEHRGLFRSLSSDRAGVAIQRVGHKMLLDLVREDVKSTFPNEQPNSDALVHFITGALFGVLMWWFEGSTKISAREINAIFRHSHCRR